MEINTALKKARQSRGLTQEQFVAGILSPAHYSKIERGLHEISAKDLMAILQKNNCLLYTSDAADDCCRV